MTHTCTLTMHNPYLKLITADFNKEEVIFNCSRITNIKITERSRARRCVVRMTHIL